MIRINLTLLLIIATTFITTLLANCKQQIEMPGNRVEQPHNNETEIKETFIPKVFKVSGIGYQGPSQAEIDKLPIFTVNPDANATQNINKAILDASKQKSGGRVIINAGTYVVETLNLKSNVHILLKPDVLLKANQEDPSKKNEVKQVFVIGNDESLENITIIGEGEGNHRARIKYVREDSAPKKGGTRAFSIGRVLNLFIQNLVIEDQQTRFSGVAFTFKKGDYSKNGRASNVTVDHVEQIDASYGYGLIQANTGANMLLTNLVCSGGVTARIETDNRGREEDIKVGVDNIRIENVKSIKGKCAVYFKPHNLISGKVTVDGAYSVGSQTTIEIREGRNGGRFGEDSWIKNVAAVYTLDAPVHFSGKSSIPLCLLPYFKEDKRVDADNKGVRQGPSITVIADYVGQIRIDKSTVSATVSEPTEADNAVSSRSLIVKGDAYRGNDPQKQCGGSAYD